MEVGGSFWLKVDSSWAVGWAIKQQGARSAGSVTAGWQLLCVHLGPRGLSMFFTLISSLQNSHHLSAPVAAGVETKAKRETHCLARLTTQLGHEACFRLVSQQRFQSSELRAGA